MSAQVQKLKAPSSFLYTFTRFAPPLLPLTTHKHTKQILSFALSLSLSLSLSLKHSRLSSSLSLCLSICRSLGVSLNLFFANSLSNSFFSSPQISACGLPIISLFWCLVTFLSSWLPPRAQSFSIEKLGPPMKPWVSQLINCGIFCAPAVHGSLNFRVMSISGANSSQIATGSK